MAHVGRQSIIIATWRNFRAWATDVKPTWYSLERLYQQQVDKVSHLALNVFWILECLLLSPCHHTETCMVCVSLSMSTVPGTQLLNTCFLEEKQTHHLLCYPSSSVFFPCFPIASVRAMEWREKKEQPCSRVSFLDHASRSTRPLCTNKMKQTTH